MVDRLALPAFGFHVLLVETKEVDRLNHERREAALAGRVGNDIAGEWKQEPRRFDEDERLDHLLVDVTQREDAGIFQLDQKDRLLQVCRQAVLDTRRAVHWLHSQGYERIGILGTSLGSCLAMLTAAHEPLVKAAALNHISPYFADVVWEGLSTAHVRAGLDGDIDLERLRELWLPISPEPYISRMKGKDVLLVYARYDLSFPVHLSEQLVNEFKRRDVHHRVFVLPCGHYSTGVAPFSWIDGYALVTFLRRTL